MDINSDSVKLGINDLSKVTYHIQETRKYIAQASANLDRRISNPYVSLKENLRKIELREQDVVELCSNFISDVEQTSEEVRSLSPTTPGEMEEDTELSSNGTSMSSENNNSSNEVDNTNDLAYAEYLMQVESQRNGNSNSGISNETDDVVINTEGSESKESMGEESESNTNYGDSSIEGENKSDSEESVDLLTEEDYKAIEAVEDTSYDSFVDEDSTTDEYLKQLVLVCEYLNDADKEYINAQLAKGNIRAAIGRILIAQKRQEVEAIKQKKPFQEEAYIEGAVKKIKEAQFASINSKEQMDLYYLEVEWIQKLNELKCTKDYCEAQAELAAAEQEIAELERECKLWEYDYLIPIVKDGDADAVREKLLEMARKEESQAVSASVTAGLLSSGPYMNFSSYAAAKPYLDTAECYEEMVTVLSDEEILTYWYLRENESLSTANEYLEQLEAKINSYYGMKRAEKDFYAILDADSKGAFWGDVVADLEGIKVGTVQWFEVVENLFSKTGTMTKSEYEVLYLNSMLGSVSYFIPLTASDLGALKNDKQINSQTYNELVTRVNNGETVTYLDVAYENNMINENEYQSFKILGEDPSVKDFIERNNTESGFLGMSHIEWLKHFFNIGVTTGNMLPSILASYATAGVLGAGGAALSTINTASKAAGLATMYVYCLSSDKNAALREGRNSYEAWIHGILAATSEVGTELIFDKIFGFIPGLPDFGMAPSATKWKAIGKIALRLFVLAPIGEITEEMVQYALLDPASDIIAYGDTDFKFKLEEALNIALTTYVSTFQMQLGTTIISAPSTVRKSGTMIEMDLGNGTKVRITYNDIVKCYNQETGYIDYKKLSEIITKKSGVVVNVNGTDVGLTFQEIESCKNPSTGEIDHAKIDQIVKEKLQAMESQTTAPEARIEFETDLDAVLSTNPNYQDVTNDYIKNTNFKMPSGCIIVFDSGSGNYLLLNSKGEVIRNLTTYEDVMAKSKTVDVTEQMKGTIEVKETEYLLYDKESGNLYLVDFDGKGKFLGKFDIDIEDATVQDEKSLLTTIVSELHTKYEGKGVNFEIDGDKCTVTIGDDSFTVTVDTYDIDSVSEKLDMLLDSNYFRFRNIYSNSIDRVEVSDGKYHITTKVGDVVTLTKEQISGVDGRTIMDAMTDFDYESLRDMYKADIKESTYDVQYKVYFVTLTTGEVITFNANELWQGTAENMIISATDPNVIDFKQRNAGKFVSINYDGSTYAIVVNKYGDTIFVNDLTNGEAQTQLDLLNSEEYLKVREAYYKRVISINLNDSNEFVVLYKGVKSRRDYTFTFSESLLGTQTLTDNFEMFLSEEFDDFYNRIVFAFNYAVGIDVKDGKYVVTRLDGTEVIREKGTLFEMDLLHQLLYDHFVDTCKDGIASWTQNGDTYTINSVDGDTFVLTIEQLKNSKIYDTIESILTNKNFRSLRTNFSNIIQQVSIDDNGNITITTTYGDNLTVSYNAAASENFFFELMNYRYRHEATLMEDGRYRIVDKYGQEFILTEAELADDNALLNIYNQTLEHEAALVNDWMLSNIEGMPNNITPAQQAAMDAKVDDIANRIGATREEVYAAINKGLKNIVNTSSFGNRVSLNTLELILKSWIKNQHETNTSSGANNPPARRRLESSVFFVPKTVDARDAAVYGMLFPDLDTAIDPKQAADYYKNGPGSWYGGKTIFDKTQAVIIYDKSKILSNTTITIGDSLDYAFYHQGNYGIFSGSAASNPQFTGSFDNFLDNVNTLDEIENASLETFAPKYGKDVDQYIEIQVHGRYAHSIDVIQEVIFLETPDPSLTKMLDDMGIKWRII